MGGRGSESGITGTKSLIVKFGNGMTTEFREKNGILVKRGVGGTFEPVGSSKTLNELVNNAKANGYEYKTMNATQVKAYDKAYRESREAASKQLNDLWFRAAPKKKKGWKGH